MSGVWVKLGKECDRTKTSLSFSLICHHTILLFTVTLCLPNEYLEQAISDPVRVKEIKVWPCKWRITIKQCCFFCIVAQYY